jgi:hypothetical protein
LYFEYGGNETEYLKAQGQAARRHDTRNARPGGGEEDLIKRLPLSERIAFYGSR